MKNLILLFLTISIISCKSKMPKPEVVTETPTEKPAESRFVTIKPNEIDFTKKNKTYELGKRLLDACNTSKFKQFSKTEATDKVIQNATIEKISKTCQKINLRNGKFIDLDLLEILYDNQTDVYIFRYDIDYEKKYFKRELKITLDNQNRISAISTKEIPKKPM